MPRRLVQDMCLKNHPKISPHILGDGCTKTKTRTHILSLENREKLESIRTAAENIKPAIAWAGRAGGGGEARDLLRKLNLEVWGDGLVGKMGGA